MLALARARRRWYDSGRCGERGEPGRKTTFPLMQTLHPMKTRFLSAALAAMLLPAAATGETEVVNGITWTYTIRGGQATLSDDAVPRSTSGIITIPSILGGCPVTAIGNYAFSGHDGLTSVIIPYGVTSIGDDAFSYCWDLSSVTIPDSVTRIGARAFSLCERLSWVTFPYSLRSIGNGAFSECTGLKSVIIPNAVTNIEEGAFYRCSGLTSVTIPGSVTRIGNNAFSSCNLERITVDGNNSVFDSRNECNAIIQTKDNMLVVGCKNTMIPTSVTSIGPHAFSGCFGDTSIIIPSGVTNIMSEAFCGCNLAVTIPDTVSAIGDHAFSDTSGSISFLGPYITDIPSAFPYSSITFRCRRDYAVDYFRYFGKDRFAGFINGTPLSVEILSSTIRENDPTVLDVVYKVTSDQPTVNVRALAFENGDRGFATVIRPDTFIDGTETNLGDGIAANVEHLLSWKISSNWATDLAKVKFEVLCMRPGDLLLQMDFISIPAAEGHPKTIVSVNNLSAGQYSIVGGGADDNCRLLGNDIYLRWWTGAFGIVGHQALLNALFWLYASNDPELSVENGSLFANGKTLVRHAAFAQTYNGYWGSAKDAFSFVFRKMGYRILEDISEIAWINGNTRLSLKPGDYWNGGWVSNGFGQFAVKTVEE